MGARGRLGGRSRPPTGPAFKPLPVAVCALLAPLGSAAPVLWVVLVRAAAGVALWLAYRLGRELGGSRWAGAAGRGGRGAGGRVRAGGRAGERGAARDRGRARRRWRAGAPGGCARRWRSGRRARCCGWRRGRSCALAGVVAWRRDAGARPLLAALALLVPAAWFVPEWLGSGDVLRSGARARVPNPGQPALADVPALASLWAAAKLLLIPLWLGVVLALRDRRARDRSRRPAARGCCSSRRWPQAGFSGEPRYALPGVALLAIAGAAGLARAALPAAPSSPRRGGGRGGAGGGRSCATCATPRRTSGRWRATSTTRSRRRRARGGARLRAPVRRPLPRAADGLRARRDQAHGRARRARRAPPASSSARGSPPRPRPRPRPARRSAPPRASGSGRCCAAAPRIRVP